MHTKSAQSSYHGNRLLFSAGSTRYANTLWHVFLLFNTQQTLAAAFLPLLVVVCAIGCSLLLLDFETLEVIRQVAFQPILTFVVFRIIFTVL